MNGYIEAWKKYAVFDGRSTRSEYWLFTLGNMLAGVIFGLLGAELLSALYTLAALIPGIAVSVRRLHDIGRSGWWLLIVLLPIVGLIVWIVFMVTDSQPGGNQYGGNPKGEIGVAVAEGA